MDNEHNIFQFKSLPKKTFEITADVLWEEIKKTEDAVLEEEGGKIEVKGFRKGKAPANLIKEKLGKEKIIRLVLEKILPQYYQKAVAQFNLKPIVSPKIELLSADEDKSWQVKFTSCEEPAVELGDYKDQIKKVIGPTAEIWTPDSKKPPENKEKDKDAKDKKINSVLDWLIKNIKIEISDMLIEEEVSRKLSSLLDQTQKLGITVEQYLSSSKQTIEAVKEEYKRQAVESLSFEFILGKIAESEKIEVTEEDLTKAVANAKDDEEKKAIESQKYYLAILLRRQKTLDFLASL